MLLYFLTSINPTACNVWIARYKNILNSKKENTFVTVLDCFSIANKNEQKLFSLL
jgi:hypothetical protein